MLNIDENNRRILLLKGVPFFEFKKTGKEDVYFSNTLQFFTQEEHIKEAGFEVFIKRKYRKIVQEGTKTPKFVTLVTIPFNTAPSIRSSMLEIRSSN